MKQRLRAIKSFEDLKAFIKQELMPQVPGFAAPPRQGVKRKVGQAGGQAGSGGS